MKVVSTEGLTKLIQLVKSAFIKVEDVVETEEVTLADVATSGDYDDLINKPTIPTATSDLTNDSGYITSSALTPYVLSTDLASVATSGSYNDLSNKPDLSAKANIDLSNCTKPYITETYVNGTSWYRVYSDGWCEQGGITGTGVGSISLLVNFIDLNYIVLANVLSDDTQQAWNNQVNIKTKTTNSFIFPATSTKIRQWRACGYIS